MLFDLSETQTHLSAHQYDVCIAGAGPAGITIARTLADQGKRVLLLEGGELIYTDRSQSIYKGRNIGEKYFDDFLDLLRLRYLGGTSGHWGGRCSLFNSADFEDRGYHSLPGWPIRLDEILHYLDRAIELVDIPKGSLRRSSVEEIGDGFESADREYSTTHFGDKYLDELKQSEHIDVYINANVTNIILKPDLHSVSHLEVKDYRKNSYTCEASQYVLAMGTLENARILLNCDSQIATGIGNHSDMVGRCFMDHFNIRYGRFVIEKKKYWQNDDHKFEVSPTVQKVVRENIGNAIFQLKIFPKVPDYGRFRKLKHLLRESVCSSKLMTEASRMAFDLNCPGDGLITSMIEQVPNLESRVLLDSVEDSLGLRRIKLNWQVTDTDRRTIRVLGMDMAKAMASSKTARVQLNDFALDSSIKIKRFGSHAHQMGTTRMSADPKYGVVDPNCKIHGISNFYVAGSSVYPTGGGTNPTLTLLMISMRLADHLLKTGAV